ncbi:MAG: hypothetical protein WC554_12150 [Clostridia bacterium]
MKPTRLTKEEVLRKAADFWYRFSDKLHGEDYHSYVKQVLEEWEQQNKMSDEQLIKYRDKQFKNSVGEAREKFKKENENFDKKDEEFEKRINKNELDKNKGK